MKIVVTERESLGLDISMDILREFGELIEYPVSTVENVAERINDADIVIVNKVRMNESTLADCPNVKLILEAATGTDNIDIEYCKSRGIAVRNVKGYSTPAVAQHTFALYFYLAEHLPKYDAYVKSGEYSAQTNFAKFDWLFNELCGKTWGIIGLGEIGRCTAQIAAAFGCKVVYYSASGRSYDVPYEQVDFDTLLTQSDVVSIHAPLNEYTRGIMDLEAIRKMKKSAYLINVGRGPIIKDEDLAIALEEGAIAGAGLDVLTAEPMTKDNPLRRIQDSDKLIITPHMAWASVEARERLVHEMYLNAKTFFAGEDRNVIC